MISRGTPKLPIAEPDERPRVLVVDDYADGRELYAEYLEIAGYQVETARNGAEALEQAISNPPDIVLMDLSMPVMDGVEATRRLRADARTHDIPVVAMSAHVSDEHRSMASDAGCDDFVAKPALPADVEARIRRLLAHGR